MKKEYGLQLSPMRNTTTLGLVFNTKILHEVVKIVERSNFKKSSKDEVSEKLQKLFRFE